jgi:hypothetical protein
MQPTNTSMMVSFVVHPESISKNEKDYSSTRTIRSHLFENGFMPNYNIWTERGEIEIMLENDEEEDDFVPHFKDDYYCVWGRYHFAYLIWCYVYAYTNILYLIYSSYNVRDKK